MGEIRARIGLENGIDAVLCEAGKLPRGKIRSAETDALVDTGAVMLLLPQDLVEKLGLRKTEKAIVSPANDEKVELDVAGDVIVAIAGRKWKTDCLVGPPQCEPLVGQLILERLDLILDPLRRTVTPRPESPYLPSLKLK